MHNDPYRQMFFEANALSRNSASNPMGPDWRINCLLEAMELEPGSRVLYTGCGTGRLIPHIKTRLGLNGQLIAIDASAEALSRVPFNDAKWAALIQSGTDKIPVIDNSIDSIVYPFSFKHLSTMTETAAEFYRVLKAGGRAFVVHLSSSSPNLNSTPPCPFALNSIFLQAGFNRIDFDDDLGLFLFTASKLEVRFFAESASA